jgi:hypothetical protein
MINKLLNSKVLMALLFVTMISSCRKDFGDMNIDPSQPSPTELRTRMLLANAQLSVAGIFFGNNSPNFYAQYLSEGPYPGASLYSTVNFDWSATYTGPLYDLQKILEYVDANAPQTAGGGDLPNQRAVADILMCLYYSWLTDRFGDIPYSQALRQDVLAPAYDKQSAVYDDLFKRLTADVAAINTAGNGVTGDLMFAGSMIKWKKFANTLRMDLALRISNVDAARGKTEFAAAVADAAATIQSNSDNMVWNYNAAATTFYNPWYSNYTVSARNDYAISKTMTDYMLPKNDARLSVYAEQLSGTYVGLPYGTNSAVNIPNAYSRIGTAFRGMTSAARLFNYPQVLFMYAEAYKIGYLAGGDAAAETAYQNAIKASWEMNGVYGATAFNNYYAQVTYNAGTAIQQIITEKWVHNYLNGNAAWNDWRKTGYPVLVPGPGSTNLGGIPVRQAYATSERNLNKASYEAAVASQGPDNLDTKVWWDK